METSNGWEQWGKHVLKEQERQNECLIEHGKVISMNSTDIAMLKIKASIWGGIAGLIPSLGILIYYIVKNVK